MFGPRVHPTVLRSVDQKVKHPCVQVECEQDMPLARGMLDQVIYACVLEQLLDEGDLHKDNCVGHIDHGLQGSSFLKDRQSQETCESKEDTTDRHSNDDSHDA